MKYRIYLHERGGVGLAGESATLEAATLVAGALWNILAGWKGLPTASRPQFVEANPQERWGAYVCDEEDEIVTWLGDEPPSVRVLRRSA